jgi:hypothetical protein
LVLVGGFAWLGSGCGKVDKAAGAAQLSADCGQAMAALARDALDGGHRVLVLENQGAGLAPERQEWLKGQMDAFYAALPANLEVEKVLVGSGSAGPVGEEGIPSDALRHYGFAPYASRAPDADVIVSFIGEPTLGQQGPAEWKDLPPVVCFSTDGTDVAPLMQAGVLAAAVAPRHAAASAKAGNRGDWFALLYEVVTPENLEAWALQE